MPIIFSPSLELTMKSAKTLNWKSGWIAAFVFLCLISLILFGKRNPSKSESEMSLRMMNRDMNFALQAGGKIESRYSNAKFGGALLFVNINAESWSYNLADKYRISLLSHGWIQRGATKGIISLCKDGVSATIILVPDFDSSKGLQKKVYGFSMSYGGDTISACKA